MKKIFAIALVIVMMAAISIPAFAANVDHDGNENAVNAYESATTIEYGVKQSYTVSIPETIVLDKSEADGKRSGTGAIVVSDAYIAANVDLVLSVTSAKTDKETDARWLLKDSKDTGATDVEYTITSVQTQGDAEAITYDKVAKEGTILSVGSAVAFEDATATLTFLADKTMQVTTYEDKLTFTVNIVSRV